MKYGLMVQAMWARITEATSTAMEPHPGKMVVLIRENGK